jgi:hypothetical protein
VSGRVIPGTVTFGRHGLLYLFYPAQIRGKKVADLPLRRSVYGVLFDLFAAAVWAISVPRSGVSRSFNQVRLE